MALLMLGIGLWMLFGQWHGRHEHSHEATHRHFGVAHAHQPAQLLERGGRPSWGLLLALGVAGGLLPDPAALAVLLAAIASGKLVLGLLTVVVFSLGFASVLVVVGAVVGRLGQAALAAINPRWVDLLQWATALVITGVGAVMSVGAWQQLA
jgi:nickel/cobalt exporter